MSSKHGTPSGIFVNFLAALVKAAPRDLANKVMLAWTDNGEELTRVLRAALAEGPRQTQADADQQSAPAKSRPSHSDIRIERVFGDEKIVFVGFIRNDDKDGYVRGDVMLGRVYAAGFVLIEDTVQLELHKGAWARDSELAPYCIVTNERHRLFPNRVRLAYCDRRGGFWRDLGHGFDRNALVACHAR